MKTDMTMVIAALLAASVLGFTAPVPAQQVPSAEDQVAAALLPLPEALRAGAGVRGFSPTMERVTLRPSGNGMTCIGDLPGDDVFDVRCYNDEFLTVIRFAREVMARDTTEAAVDAGLKEAIASGRLSMPDHPTAGYRMLGPITAYDPRSHTAGPEIGKWQSVHFPFETAEALGLPTEKEGTMPYVMSSGTWWSHVMIEH